MRALIPLLVAATLVAGCGSGQAGPGASGTAPPDGPISTVVPPAGGEPPVAPRPTWVEPHPGAGPLTAVRPIALRARLGESGHALAVVRWWSGVEPCYALRPVGVVRRGRRITLRLFEGSDDPAAACIEIAQLKATRVDLGLLSPGRYTIVAAPRMARLTID